MHWEDVPSEIRAIFEERLGANVVKAVTQPQGFSPGVAARLLLSDGRRVFLKAVSEKANPDTPGIHRREARILAALPLTAPIARMLWSYDDKGWVALCLEDVDGRHPGDPWTDSDLDLVIATVEKMSLDLTPSPVATTETVPDFFSRTVNGWRIALEHNEPRLDAWEMRNLARLAQLEAQAPALTRGVALVHCDVRADNILIAGERVYFVDWPWARRGAWWIDLLLMAPSVEMQGGPTCEEFLRRIEIGDVAKEAVDAVVCTMAGYFVVHALDPPPQGIPTVRAFQAAQGGVATAWLRQRTGWD